MNDTGVYETDDTRLADKLERLAKFYRKSAFGLWNDKGREQETMTNLAKSVLRDLVADWV